MEPALRPPAYHSETLLAGRPAMVSGPAGVPAGEHLRNPDSALVVVGLEHADFWRVERCAVAHRFRTGCVLSLLPVAMGKPHLGLPDLLRPAWPIGHSFVCRPAALLGTFWAIIRRMGILEVPSPICRRSIGSYIFTVQRKSGLAVVVGWGSAASTAPSGGFEFGHYGRGEYRALP